MDYNIDWGFSWSVVITGLVVVFAVLILLVLLCMTMGKIFESIDKKRNSSNNSPSTPSPVKAQGGAATVDMIQSGIGDDVVAAITAAIAVIMSSEGNQKPFAVKSIKRARDARPVWNVTGISENTRPF